MLASSSRAAARALRTARPASLSAPSKRIRLASSLAPGQTDTSRTSKCSFLIYLPDPEAAPLEAAITIVRRLAAGLSLNRV
jgi:hypothetical protein